MLVKTMFFYIDTLDGGDGCACCFPPLSSLINFLSTPPQGLQPKTFPPFLVGGVGKYHHVLSGLASLKTFLWWLTLCMYCG
jgi:hypothetical protein